MPADLFGIKWDAPDKVVEKILAQTDFKARSEMILPFLFQV